MPEIRLYLTAFFYTSENIFFLLFRRIDFLKFVSDTHTILLSEPKCSFKRSLAFCNRERTADALI